MLIRFHQIFKFWRTFILVAAPLLASPLLIIYTHDKALRCAWVMIVMAVYWMTEAIPLPATALIPVVAFPLLGIMSTEETCLPYMKESTMFFTGGLIIAAAVEHSNLHKRIALNVILKVGQSPSRLMIGFMITTMFLSMWISNTSAAAMMVPIVNAVLQELYKTYNSDDLSGSMNLSSIRKSEDNELDYVVGELEKPKHIQVSSQAPPNATCKSIRDMLFLATAYAANIGGTGSITGTGSNIVAKGVLKSSFPDQNDINFASWSALNVPGMLVCSVVAFFWLQFFFIGIGSKRHVLNIPKDRENAIRAMVKRDLNSLGKMTFHEGVVLFWFIILVLLYLTMAPGFMKGWSHIFVNIFGPQTSIDDATTVMFIILLLFAIPAKPNFNCFTAHQEVSVSEPCLTWKACQEKVPWGIVLLVGGGYSMAKGTKVSGLSTLVSEELRKLQVFPPFVLVSIVCLVTSFLTEITSNQAMAAVIIPVFRDLGQALCINPIYFIVPAAVCCSYAFMLPVATPPNAIVYAASNMDSSQMIKAGFILNFLCVVIEIIAIHALGPLIIDVLNFPQWANTTNATAHC